MGYITRGYRKVFGRRSPYRRVYGSRSAGRAIGVTARQAVIGGGYASKLAKDVAQIKRSLNVEKKYIDAKPSNTAPPVNNDYVYLGHVNGNTDGSLYMDVTPLIGQGTAFNQRVGNSCKLTGMQFKYQIQGMNNTRTKRRVRMMLLKTRDVGSDATSTQIHEALFDVNPINGIRDLQSNRNYESMKHNGISVVKTKTCYLSLAHCTSDGAAVSSVEEAHTTGTFRVSFSDVLRFADASDTSPEHVKYWLLVQMDVGNGSTTTDSTLDVPVPNNSSGARAHIHSRTWWVDN